MRVIIDIFAVIGFVATVYVVFGLTSWLRGSIP